MCVGLEGDHFIQVLELSWETRLWTVFLCADAVEIRNCLGLVCRDAGWGGDAKWRVHFAVNA